MRVHLYIWVDSGLPGRAIDKLFPAERKVVRRTLALGIAARTRNLRASRFSSLVATRRSCGNHLPQSCSHGRHERSDLNGRSAGALICFGSWSPCECYGLGMGLTEFRRRKFAEMYDSMGAAYDEVQREPKRELLKVLHGRVVEIGPGTGVNLELLPEGVEWLGIEPNDHMHPMLREKAKKLGLKDVDLRCLSAGKLPLEDASVDCVLATLVLCSVPDVDGTLQEIKRVLKPGGKFVFWEHVIDPKLMRRRMMQHMFNPLQRFIANGCCCNRDFLANLERAQFTEIEMEPFRIPKGTGPPWIRSHVRGVALR
jgi:ubiquinone/menaquinone biosynthesis C-methylase UbiE